MDYQKIINKLLEFKPILQIFVQILSEEQETVTQMKINSSLPLAFLILSVAHLNKVYGSLVDHGLPVEKP